MGPANVCVIMIKHIAAIPLTGIAIAVTFTVYGQQKDQTLGSLWAGVEANYPGIAAKVLAVDAALLNERAVKAGRLPLLKAQAQNTYGTYDGSSGAFFPQSGFFNVSGAADALSGPSFSPNSFASATAEWEVFSFGRLQEENEAAHALTGQKAGEKEAYVLQLKKALSERYINLLYNEAKLRWNQRNAERLDHIRRITTGQSASGLKPAADSLLALSSYIQSLGDNDRLKANREAALTRLLELSGADNVYYQASVRRFSEPAEGYSGEAGGVDPSHPVLAALDSRSQYYAHSSAAERKAALPSVRLLGGYAFRGTGINPQGTVSGKWKDGFSNTAHNFLAGIGVTWNITHLHVNQLKGNGMLKEAESARMLYAQYERDMQAGLSAARARITGQLGQLEKTDLAVTRAREAYEMYMARYKSGLIPLNDLLQIQMLLEQAEDKHIGASQEYWMLRAYEAELTADFAFLFNNL